MFRKINWSAQADKIRVQAAKNRGLRFAPTLWSKKEELEEMEKTCKRLVSFLIALVMVLAMIPFDGLEVYAAETGTFSAYCAECKEDITSWTAINEEMLATRGTEKSDDKISCAVLPE